MPLYVSGVYWLLPTISFSTLSSFSEVAFAEGRTLGGSLWTLGGQFALPSVQILGIDVFAESGLIATPPDTLAFQPRLFRAGGSGWEDDGIPGELGSGVAVLSLPYTLTLAPGDRFGIEVYTTGGMVQVPGGLRVVVRLA